MKTQLLDGADKFWKRKDLSLAVHDVMMNRGDSLKRDLDTILGESLDGLSVLDLGCGGGRIFLLYDILRYYGVDQSRNMLDIAEEESAKIAWEREVASSDPDDDFSSTYQVKLDFAHSDLMDFQSNEHFDIVLLLNVIQHVHNPIELLEHTLHFDADTYVIEFFLNTAGRTQYHDTSTGTTSVSRPRAFVDDIVSVMENNGLRTATLVGVAINTNVAPVFVAGWRDGI